MDDLNERDLSQVADADLTAEERQELRRRLRDFVAQLRDGRAPRPTGQAKARRIMRWDPITLSRRH